MANILKETTQVITSAPIVAFFGFIIVGYSLLFTLMLVFTSIVTLTFTAIVSVVGTTFISFSTPTVISVSKVLLNAILVAVSGCFTGMLIGYARAFNRILYTEEETILKGLFSKELLLREPNFYGQIIINICIGLLVGFVAGSSGGIGISHVLHNHMTATFSERSFSVYDIIRGDGFGDLGKGDGFGAALLIALMFVLQGVFIGGAAGIIYSMCASVIYGLIGRTGFAVIISMVQVSNGFRKNDSFSTIVRENFREGLKNGIITGLLVGLLHGILTMFGLLAR